MAKKGRKKNKKLSKPVRAALERGDIVPESALRGKKIPRSVKAACMRALMEKAAKVDGGYDPRVYMPRSGDSFLYRNSVGSVHSAIDQLMAEAAQVNRRERAEKMLHKPQNGPSGWLTPQSARERGIDNDPLLHVGPGVYGGV